MASKNEKQGTAYSLAPILVGLGLFIYCSFSTTRDTEGKQSWVFSPQNAPTFMTFVSGGLICFGFGLQIKPEGLGKFLPDNPIIEKVGEALLSEVKVAPPQAETVEEE